MTSLKRFALAAALVIGSLGLATTTAQAARVRIAIGGPVAYMPPCPGPGYVWVAGYYNGGVWIPGYWNFVGVGPVIRGGIVIGHGPFYGRHFVGRPVPFRR
jgi:hypothetical protein